MAIEAPLFGRAAALLPFLGGFQLLLVLPPICSLTS